MKLNWSRIKVKISVFKHSEFCKVRPRDRTSEREREGESERQREGESERQ